MLLFFVPLTSIPAMSNQTPHADPVKGKYIAIEGPDGAGKTLTLKKIKELFAEAGKEIEEVNILSTHPNSLALRKILTNPETEMHPRTELAYYIAAVLNSLTQVVQPAVRAGKTIISDRGPDSSLVFQCMTLGDGDQSMLAMHREAFAGLAPQVTIYLEPRTVTEGLDRVQERDGTLDRIERRGSAYQQSVLENYRMVAQAHAYSGEMAVIVIVNDGTVDELKEKLREALTSRGIL